MSDRLKVLLIEDNQDGASYIGRLFDRAGTTVVMEWASKLQTGLNRLAAGELDAALINLNQPESQGLPTLLEARARNAKVPIVVLTTIDNVDTAAEALRHGADDFIIKEHLTADRLQRSIQNAIRQRNAEDELAHSKEELRQSDARFQAIMNASLDAIITVDASGTILDMNPAAERVFGYRRNEAIGEEMGQLLLTEDSRRRQKMNFDKYCKGGEGSMLGTRIETTAKKENGTEIVVEMATQPIPVRGTLVFTVFMRDITERKHAEDESKRYAEELERSNRDLDQYASLVSHDLVAPLRAVATFCQLLQRDSGDKLDEKAKEYIDYIVDGTRRMQALVEDLRAFARVATEARPFERLDVQAIVKRALANLDAEIYDSGAEITNDTLPVVMADKTQLTQLFQNLISNAIKYRGEVKPAIHIAAKNKGDHWKFRVQDNGIGFEQQKANDIFQIFQRLHSDEDRYPGTGIGLAICQRIVERHHGRIWAESKPGHGSVFYFTLPMNPED